MQRYLIKPSIDLYPGVRVDKDTKLDFENEKVTQSLEGLVFRSMTRVKGEGYESTNDTTIYLKEGDILIYDEDRGYIKPVEQMVTIEEAIEDFESIKELG